MGLVQALIGSEATAGAPANPDLPPDLKAFCDRIDVDLLGYWQAFRWEAEKSAADRIVTWNSIIPTGVVIPKFVTPSEAQGLYWGIDPNDADLEEMRVGLDASDTAISGQNNKKATGTIVVPSGDFSVLARVRITSPLPSNTCLFGTVDTTDPMSTEVASNGAIRWYATRSTGLIASNSSTYVGGTTYKKILFQHDQAGALSQIQYEGSVVKSWAAHDLSSHVGQALQLGTVVDGGSTVSGSGFAIQDFAVFSAKEPTTSLGLLDDWVTARAAI